MKVSRQLCAAMGWIMLALGAAGVILPLLPTTPFVLAAAGLFSHASPRTARWLEQHPLFGRSLRQWRQRGEISVPAKLWALGSMIAGFVVTVHFGQVGNLAGGALAVILLVVALFILTRPQPSSGTGTRGAYKSHGVDQITGVEPAPKDACAKAVPARVEG